MTARVINDPSTLGWVLDPDTGRWEWSGSGDGGGAGGGGGAMPDGSFVVQWASAEILMPRAINYGDISGDSTPQFAGTDGVQPPSKTTDHYRQVYSTVWSEYWQCYFGVANPPTKPVSTATDYFFLVWSRDGVHWSDIGSVKNTFGFQNTGNAQINDNTEVKSGASMLCVDESNGRIWCAGNGKDGDRPLVAGYYDPQTATGGIAVASKVPSGSGKTCYVIDWKWIPDIQKIVILYANKTGYFNTATINAGQTSISSVQSSQIQTDSTRNEDKLRLLHCRIGGTSKFYVQGAGSRMWWRESSDFGSLTQGTSSQTSFDNRTVGMSEKYLLVVNSGGTRTDISYLRTDNDDWKTNNNSYESKRLDEPNALNFINYDPARKEWIGSGKSGRIWRSDDGLSWDLIGLSGSDIGDRKAQIVRQTSGEYS